MSLCREKVIGSHHAKSDAEATIHKWADVVCRKASELCVGESVYFFKFLGAVCILPSVSMIQKVRGRVFVLDLERK